MQPEQVALALAFRVGGLFGVGLAHQREHTARRARRRLDHVRDVAPALLPRLRIVRLDVDVAGASCRSPPCGPSGRSRCARRCPRARPSPRGTCTRRRSSRSSSGPARPGRAGAGAGSLRPGPTLFHQRRRSSFQYSSHFGPSPGGTKNSISICSNSHERKMKCSTVISLRKLLPICAMPKGSFIDMLCWTFRNCTNMACAVSGRR